jgi:hypothetical protein
LVEKGTERVASLDWGASAVAHLGLFREVLEAGNLGRRASGWRAAAGHSPAGIVIRSPGRQ